MSTTRTFATLGLFILDRFEYLDEDGRPTGRESEEQIGGGGTYAAVGARIWIPADQISMIVDRGTDFPESVQQALDTYGSDMWIFRDQKESKTTKALNSYCGERRDFKYLTPRIQITPRDLPSTHYSKYLHFICSPTRAHEILQEVEVVDHWEPVIIYEPIPYFCIPSELPSLQAILPKIDIISPNAVEAFSLLSIDVIYATTKSFIEDAASRFIGIGAGSKAGGAVIIRSGELGAYVRTTTKGGSWVDAFLGQDQVIDVTGAGNAFLGGLAAGLSLSSGDAYKATLFASISASFTIEQPGLPKQTAKDQWNNDDPWQRMKTLSSKYQD